MKEYVSSVTFIVTGQDLEPDAITKLLSLSPSQSWSRGEKRIFPNGREQIYQWGGWKLFEDPSKSDLSLEQQISSWVEILSKCPAQLQQIKALKNNLVLDCYVEINDVVSPVLEAETLFSLGTLGLNIAFNIFPGSSDSDKSPR